jgi:hypothetical protein
MVFSENTSWPEKKRSRRDRSRSPVPQKDQIPSRLLTRHDLQRRSLGSLAAPDSDHGLLPRSVAHADCRSANNNQPIGTTTSTRSDVVVMSHRDEWYDVRPLTEKELDEFLEDLLRADIADVRAGFTPH